MISFKYRLFTRNFYKVGLFVFITVTLFSGCFDDEDIDQRMIVSPMGIDDAPGQKMVVTFRMPLLKAGGSETHQRGPERSYIIRTLTSDGIVPAVIDAQNRDEHSIFLGQCRSVLFGESYARRGLGPALDFFDRLPTFPPNAFVVIARPDARAIQDINWPEQELHDQNIRLFFSNRENQKYGIKRWTLYQKVNDPLKDPLIPIVTPSDGDTTMKMVGLAVFRKDRMVGELNGEDAEIMGLIQHPSQKNRIYIPIAAPTAIGFEIVTGKKHFDVEYPKDHPVLKCRFQFNTFLSEINMYKLPMTDQEIKKIESICSRYLQKRIRTVFYRLRDMGSDPMEWGDLARVKQSGRFNQAAWPQDYQNAEFQVAVKVFIERLGVLK